MKFIHEITIITHYATLGGLMTDSFLHNAQFGDCHRLASKERHTEEKHRTRVTETQLSLVLK